MASLVAASTARAPDSDGTSDTRPPHPSSLHSAQGDALVAEVLGSIQTLRELSRHSNLFGPAAADALSTTIREVEKRVAQKELCVAVAGETGSGKRTFIDALIGEHGLAAALRGTRAIVVLRRREVMDYRARLGGVRVEQFSRVVPDRRGELAAAVEAAENVLARAETESVAAADACEHTKAEERRAARALGEAFTDFECRRAQVNEVSAELARAGAEVERAGQALVTVERSLPLAVRVQPVWWAIWAWLIRLVYRLFAARRWANYQQQRREQTRAGEHVAVTRGRASDANDECGRAEARWTSLDEEAERFREQAVAASVSLAEADSERERAGASLQSARDELARYLEDRRREMLARIASLVRAGGSKELREIEIDLPARFLPEDVAILDIMAISDHTLTDDSPAWNLIRERADGCIVISELERGVGGSTRRFLSKLRDVAPHVLLVLSKVDHAFVAAVRRGDREPWKQVEHARRIGTRRFAREIGRDADAVLSIAVSAQAALDDEQSGLARSFASEAAKLFQLLRHERALILGTRSALAIRRCITELEGAQDIALEAYRRRIAALEDQRTPPPEAFKLRQLEAAAPRIHQAALDAERAAARAAHDAIARVASGSRQMLRHARNRRQVLETMRSIESELTARLTEVWRQTQDELESAIDARVRELELDLFAELRRCYRLVHEIRRSQSSIPRLGPGDSATTTIVPLLPRVQADVTRLVRTRLAVAVAGATALALLGSVLALGWGTLLGATLGLLFGLFPGRSWLVRRATAALDAELERAEQQILERLRASGATLEVAISDALDRSLSRAITRFALLIAEPLAEEERAIAAEREALESLERLGSALKEHDDKLSAAMHAANEASLGLCR